VKIVLSGIFYPMAILRYFQQAFERRADVELFTIGIYTGRQIPWNGGMMLPEVYSKSPDYVVQSENTPIQYAENQLPWHPDLWIQIDSTWSLTGKPSCRNIIVGTDPHCIDYSRSRKYADTFYCMQTPYMKEGDKYLAYAYDPIWHTPVPNVEKVYDAGLIGAPYDSRQRLVNYLGEKGWKVLFTGYGPCYEEYRQLMTQCKVGLNVSTQKDLCARVFETMAMGLAPLINKVPDLDTLGFTDGQDYISFVSHEDADEKLKWLINEDNWWKIAHNAWKVVGPHTWDARVEQILDENKA